MRGALARFERDGEPFSGSTDPRAAGNGSLMRLAPVPLFFAHDEAAAIHHAGESSRTTHGARRGRRRLPRLRPAAGARALGGGQAGRARGGLGRAARRRAEERPLAPAIADIARGRWRLKNERDIRGSGYVVECLEAALWCFAHTTSYRDAVLLAANLGDDADTTAAVCGQLAGACYGVGAIPADWLAKLALRPRIEALADALVAAR